jgi:hypothetical protein
VSAKTAEAITLDVARVRRLAEADWPWCIKCGELPAVLRAPKDMVEVYAGPRGVRPHVSCVGCALEFREGNPLLLELDFMTELATP